MAERAIACLEGPEGYELYESRWGGADRALAEVCRGTAPMDLPDVRWERWPTTREFADLVSEFDYLSTDALYRVRGTETAVFLPLWFGLPLAEARPSPHMGALVGVSSLHETRSLRRRFRNHKGALTDALATGQVPAVVAPTVLLAAIAALDGRERYVATPNGSITAERLYANGRPEGP